MYSTHSVAKISMNTNLLHNDSTTCTRILLKLLDIVKSTMSFRACICSIYSLLTSIPEISLLRLGSFYSEIELLPRSALDHPLISFVIHIEQALSIGNYSTVVPENPPTGLGNLFLARIVETIRD